MTGLLSKKCNICAPNFVFNIAFLLSFFWYRGEALVRILRWCSNAEAWCCMVVHSPEDGRQLSRRAERHFAFFVAFCLFCGKAATSKLPPSHRD